MGQWALNCWGFTIFRVRPCTSPQALPIPRQVGVCATGIQQGLPQVLFDTDNSQHRTNKQLITLWHKTRARWSREIKIGGSWKSPGVLLNPHCNIPFPMKILVSVTGQNQTNSPGTLTASTAGGTDYIASQNVHSSSSSFSITLSLIIPCPKDVLLPDQALYQFSPVFCHAVHNFSHQALPKSNVMSPDKALDTLTALSFLNFANPRDCKSPIYCDKEKSSTILPSSCFGSAFPLPLLALVCSPKLPHPGLAELRKRICFQSEQQNWCSELNQAPAFKLL